jgi:hypothetical protein
MPGTDEIKTLSQRSLEIALSQNGVQEMPKGSNKGPDVEKYLKSVGLGGGYAWCMSFVYWCVQQAATEMGIKNPLVKTGGVMVQWNSTTCRKVPKTGNVQPGDIFIMQFGHGTGHTGFVMKVENNAVYTIEGNTNDDGSREGYEVAKRVRPLSSFIGFIKLN